MTDALIIGAGHNGLAAAVTLARRGKKVTVVEARSVAGGLCAPREFHKGFTVPGIFHDTTEVRPALLDSLGLLQQGLKLRDADVPVFVPSTKGKGLLLGKDDELGEDAAGYRELMSLVERARGPLSDALNAPPPPLVPAALGEYMELAKVGLSLRRLGAKDLYALLRLLPMCMGDLMRDHFKSDLLMAGLAHESLLSEYAGPWSAGTSARWLLKRAVAGREIHGGPAALVTALEKSLAAAQGTLKLNARVEQILVEKNTVVGVKLASGEELKAPLVGLSASPRALLTLLPPHAFPLKVFDELRLNRARGTATKIHLALSSPLAPKGRSETFERIRIGESLDELERAFDAIKYGQLSEKPALDIRQTSDNGKHVASIWVSFTPYEAPGVLELVLKRLEAYDADIRKKVVASEVLDPKALEREYSLPGGNVHHGEMVLDQLLFMRPTLRLAHYSTPVDGLFLCGSGSHPGGGVTLAPGTLGANVAFERTQQ